MAMSSKISKETDRLAIENGLFANGTNIVAGVDEAGVGAWAGPVYAGAVALRPGEVIIGAKDSKKLTPSAREALAEEIKNTASAWAIGTASVKEIAELNILGATLLAMKRAVLALKVKPEELLVDYRHLDLGIPCHSFVKGDDLCHAIACASIIAKTSRDALMLQYEKLYPGYGFAAHKGYGTADHIAAIRRLGVLPCHRTTYKPFKKLFQEHHPVQISLDSLYSSD